MIKFRPTDNMGLYKLRMRRRGVYESYNWHIRTRYYPAGLTINRQTLVKIFGSLHYLGSHAPAPVRARWRKHERRFLNSRIPQKASGRYVDAWSSARWL